MASLRLPPLYIVWLAACSASSGTATDSGSHGGGDSWFDASSNNGGVTSGGESQGGAMDGGRGRRGDGGASGMDASGTSNSMDASETSGRRDAGGTSNDVDARRVIPDAAKGSDGGSASKPDAGVVAPTCDATRAPKINKLKVVQVVGARTNLLNAAQAPASNDWYLVRQTGQIEVFASGAIRSTLFLDLSSEGLTTDERGLLGLTFHPNYASNGLFYVMLTTPDSVDQVREYQRSATDPLQADPSTRRDILVLPASESNHNAGTVLFGPDGLLYVSTGDGGGVCNNNQPGAPQDVSKPFGKILRLDPAKTSPFGADGNPFANDGDPRVLHYGLRNPFRFGFDSLTGDLYIGDVGQVAFEEINFAPKGAKGLNFGWRRYEGPQIEGLTNTCAGVTPFREGSAHTPPIFALDRMGETTPDFKDYQSVVGGIVYRGSGLPGLAGAYFFSDFSGARLGALYQCGTQTSPATSIAKTCDINKPNEACFVVQGFITPLVNVASILEGNDGEMYFVVNRDSIYKVVPN